MSYEDNSISHALKPSTKRELETSLVVLTNQAHYIRMSCPTREVKRMLKCIELLEEAIKELAS
jgi:hypothetical protein